MKKFIEAQEEELKKRFGYIFRCDDKKIPKGFDCDAYFELWEYNKVSETVKIFEDLKLNYDLVIESYDSKNDTIYQIDIKNTNWRNDIK